MIAHSTRNSIEHDSSLGRSSCTPTKFLKVKGENVDSVGVDGG
jgi:hypothetical protein